MSENESDYKILNIECESPSSSELRQANYITNSEVENERYSKGVNFNGSLI